MAEKRTTPETPGGRRKRAAPTIDLKATEVRSADETPENGATTPKPKADAQKEGPAESIAQPKSPQTRRDKEAAAGTARPQADKKEGQPPPPPPPPSPPSPERRDGFGGAIAGGIIGAVVATAAMGGLWYGGVIPPQLANDQSEQLSAQVAALQKQMQALQNRPAPAAPDTSAIDNAVVALGRRIETMEQTIANLPPGDSSVADRLAAADNAMKSLGVALTALNRRSDDIAAKAAQAEEQAAAAEKAVNELRASVQSASQQASNAMAPDQLADVRQRIAELEESVKSVRADLGQTADALQKQIAKAGAADRAARLALSASVLQSAVASGAPYASELAQAKSLGAEEPALAPLGRFAASGLPDKSALAEQLLDIIPGMRKIASPDDTGGSFLDRLQTNAGKLVRIRPVETPAGGSPADVLAQVEAKAAQEDIAGALADLARLPPPVRAPAQDWIARAEARQDALAAAQRFAVEAARALGSG